MVGCGMEVIEKRHRARRSESQWRRLIARQGDSGLSAAAFCRTEGLSLANFYRWRRRMQGDEIPMSADVGSSFVDIGAVALATDARALELRIEIGRLFKLNLIRH
jgi:hypothetical protein